MSVINIYAKRALECFMKSVVFIDTEAKQKTY